MLNWLFNKKETKKKEEIEIVEQCDHLWFSEYEMKYIITLPMSASERRWMRSSRHLYECSICGELLEVLHNSYTGYECGILTQPEEYISACVRMGIEKNAILIGRLQKKATRDTKITEILRDEKGINSLTGYAIKFDNGSGLCVIDNVLVPDKWIFEKEKLSSEDFISAENTEMRKRFVKVLGGEDKLKVLLGSSAKEINAFTLENSKVTLTTQIIDGIEVKMLNMQNTWDDSPYYLFVPPWVRTAKEGVAWSFYQDPSNYKLEVEA